MVKPSTIDAFFKRKTSQNSEPALTHKASVSDVDTSVENLHPVKSLRIEPTEVSVDYLERDPGLRRQLWEYPPDQRDEIRRAYIIAGPYQHILSKYPLSGSEKHRRRFQSSWFKLFPTWLEYSPSKDAAFCLPCYLFSIKPTRHPGSNAFIIEGFSKWKKVNEGKNCSFLGHIGKDPNSPHHVAEKSCVDLMNQSQLIETVFHKQTSQQIADNRLRLKTSIDAARWLAFQGYAFRGHDEGPESMNRGNFIEMVKAYAEYNEKVDAVVLENAPGNAKHTSPMIQKEIWNILAQMVQTRIREEVGKAKFCIIVDEARDESKKEQLALILRFVDKDGFVREWLFDLVHISDTTSCTLHHIISKVLSLHNLDVQNLRGQGYDGASNMRGEWNGLQALFIKDCSYDYYVHCFAHRLQLALVAASREVSLIWQFFSTLTSVVNVVGVSCKRHDELQASQAAKIVSMLAIDELETGRGLNQIGTLQRAGDTRWGSHLSSISSLVRMYSATCVVLENISKEGNYTQRGEADHILTIITSFKFAFILHLMQDVMGITNDLYQALQRQSQDIVNAMHLVSTSKALIQQLRETGWDPLLKKVKLFCVQHDIDILDMDARYTAGRGRPRHMQDYITMEHHYRIDIFNAAIDSQLQELNTRFNERTIELVILSTALDPNDGFKSFNIDGICRLADKFYPLDFTEQEKLHLRYQLQHYERDVFQHPDLKKMSTVAQLCRGLMETGKLTIYPLIDRLIRLVLTLLVSTATTERAFTAMKMIKTRLRNKMDDEFLGDCLLVYVEKELAIKFTTDMIINEFYSMKERRVQLK